jgi:regulator of sigma E protease
VNIVLAFLILWVLFLSEGKPVARIGVLETQSPPASKVLRAGDLILSVDGVRGYAPGQSDAEIERRAKALRNAIAAHKCAGRPVAGCVAAKPARLVVQRGKRTLTLNVAPRYDAKAKRMLVGFSFGGREDLNAVGAADASVTGMWNVTTTTVDNIVRLFYDKHARDQVSGVVGSFEATRQTFEFDTVRAVTILALISLSLAIINLFPFLPLDGGHIFWALAEKVRGRAISFRVMERASLVGFMLVLFLFYVGLSNDIGRLTSGEGFGVR